MLELEENEKNLIELYEKFKEIKKSVKIDSLKNKLNELEKITSNENFWQNNNISSNTLMEIKQLNQKIETFDNIEKELNSLTELNELLKEEFDRNLLIEIQNNIKIIINKIG